AGLAELEARTEAAWLVIPNAPHASVPRGHTPDDNPVLHTWGDEPAFAFPPKPHWELAPGLLDFEAGAKVAGARFTVLRGVSRRLTRGLVNYMLDLHAQRGYTEVWPPAIVRRAALRGTGQLPKFK